MNLDEMSLRELQDLQKKVAKAIENYDYRIRKEAYDEILARARQLGFKLDELIASQVERRSISTVKPKYRHPENWELTWSGRGRRPQWFSDALASGLSERELLVQ